MRKRLLIIEDDPRYVDLLRLRLENAGYEVALALDGEQGLARACEQPRPDLVLTDVLLPRRDGFEICHELKSAPETSGLPVILMSAVFMTEDDRERGLRAGANRYLIKPDAYVEKPIRFEHLLDHIRFLLGESTEMPIEEVHEKLLIVDDDPRNRRLVKMALLRSSYVLFEAASASAALELLEREPIDLVLSDIRMPGMDGLELLREIRRRQPQVTVVMMTAHGSQAVAVEAMKSGANDYLTKPLNVQELDAVLRENLTKHQLKLDRARLHQQLRETSRDLMTRLAALERQNEALQESSDRIRRTIQAQSDFVSTLSHELRTPMTVIRGALALATEGGDRISQAQGQQLIQRARAHTERVISLIEKLLDFQRIEAGIEVRQQGVDLVQLLRRECDALGPAATEAEMKILFESELEQAPAIADPDAIERIVTNLVGNALKYAPAGSSVDVSIERSDDAWRFAFGDRGPGVPDEIKQRIFERFSRGEHPKPDVHSTGLGLAIVRTLVEQHRGRVGVEDREGGGALFWCEIPCPDVDTGLGKVIGGIGIDDDMAAELEGELLEVGFELHRYSDATALFDDHETDLGGVIVDLASEEASRGLYSLLKGFENRGLRRACLIPAASGMGSVEEASRLFQFVEVFLERPTASELAELFASHDETD